MITSSMKNEMAANADSVSVGGVVGKSLGAPKKKCVLVQKSAATVGITDLLVKVMKDFTPTSTVPDRAASCGSRPSVSLACALLGSPARILAR